jgi:flagellar motor switch protein FliN/FliY
MSDEKDGVSNENLDEAWVEGSGEGEAPAPTADGTEVVQTEPAPDYQRAEFQDLQADASKGRTLEENLDVILDIPVQVSMEIGRSRIPIRNLLQLNQGSVVELDRVAGEPLDVLVNGTLIAHGEVVVVNDKFGIRLTDVVSASERIRKLR